MLLQKITDLITALTSLVAKVDEVTTKLQALDTFLGTV